MTRILTLLFVLGVFFGTAIGEQFDVRKVRWGMSVDEVKASEKWGDPKSELRDDGLYEIMYKGKMLGESVMLGYVFDGDRKSRKLVSVTYAFSYNITLHLRLKTLLIEKYGLPDSTDRHTAAKLRDFVMWNTQRTRITLYKITLVSWLDSILTVSYRSREYIAKEQEHERVQESRIKDDL